MSDSAAPFRVGLLPAVERESVDVCRQTVECYGITFVGGRVAVEVGRVKLDES